MKTLLKKVALLPMLILVLVACNKTPVDAPPIGNSDNKTEEISKTEGEQTKPEEKEKEKEEEKEAVTSDTPVNIYWSYFIEQGIYGDNAEYYEIYTFDSKTGKAYTGFVIVADSDVEYYQQIHTELDIKKHTILLQENGSFTMNPTSETAGTTANDYFGYYKDFTPKSIKLGWDDDGTIEYDEYYNLQTYYNLTPANIFIVEDIY